MKKESFYFSHDYHARTDHKLVSLSMKYGMEGIGIYWCIIEMLYESGGYLMRTEYERIAFELRTDIKKIESVFNDFNLFESDAEKYWSKSAIERLNLREQKSLKATESVNKRWNNTNVLRTQYDSNTIKERKVKDSKGKERKVKEIKIKESKAVEAVASPLFKDCISVYNDFIKEKTGASAKIDGAQGNAMKSIIKYLLSQEKISGSEDQALIGWKFILTNFDKTEPFIQKQLKLTQINSNITNILDQIKNGIPKSGTTKKPLGQLADEVRKSIEKEYGAVKPG